LTYFWSEAIQVVVDPELLKECVENCEVGVCSQVSVEVADQAFDYKNIM